MNVNDAFDAQRADQIRRAADRKDWMDGEVKAGTMRQNPNGTYTVLGGFDAGEVFQANGQPEHGLETLADGTVAAYLNGKPAWWSLGSKVPGNAKSTSAILRFAGLDFTVGIKPTPYHFEDGRVDVSPGSFQTFVKANDRHAERVLGQVGKVFTPVQPVQSFGLLDELTKFLPVETAGLFKDYRRMFVSARAPESSVIDPGGVEDEVINYVLLTDAWDGSTKLTARLTPWLVRCKNTHDLAVKGAKSSFAIRHTANWQDKAAEASRVLGLTREYYDAFTAEETALARTPFMDNQVDALIAQIWGEEDADASKRGKTLRQSRVDSVHKWWEIEKNRLGKTAYAAENAITGHVDHDRSWKLGKGEARKTPLMALGDAILSETTALSEPKREAHRKLMMLTNR